MLATGLGILKMIGFILLGILGLLLAVILLGLCVPVRYRIEASRYDEWKASLRFSWLLHILTFQVVYDGELETVFRIFGFRFRRHEEREDIEETVHNVAEDIIGHYAGELKEQVDEVKAERDEPQKAAESEKTDRAPQTDKSHKHSGHSGKKKQSSGKKTFSITKIYDRLIEIKEKIIELFELLKKEEKTLKLIWKQLRSLLKHFLPLRARGRIRFGFDDPYVTGQVLTYISPFYSTYGKRIDMIPVFEEQVLDGEIYLRGRIRVGTAVWILLVLWRDQNIRKLWRQWRE
ncbi:MAG: DUF2953 domain-containing protein [Lachnospiraceae bacterium]